MGYITKSRLSGVTEQRKKSFSKGLSAPVLLSEAYDPNKKYDIFLSHSYMDKEEIASLKLILENYGFSVYVDWINDADLNRSKVNKKTASRIRVRMKNCKSLIYAISNNSPSSKWMPWELGYFDGLKGMVAILPITKLSNESLRGTEYLHLYPVIQEEKIENLNKDALWVIDNDYTNVYVNISQWINDRKKPYAH